MNVSKTCNRILFVFLFIFPQVVLAQDLQREQATGDDIVETVRRVARLLTHDDLQVSLAAYHALEGFAESGDPGIRDEVFTDSGKYRSYRCGI